MQSNDLLVNILFHLHLIFTRISIQILGIYYAGGKFREKCFGALRHAQAGPKPPQRSPARPGLPGMPQRTLGFLSDKAISVVEFKV